MLSPPRDCYSLASLEDDQLLSYISSSLASAPSSRRRRPASPGALQPTRASSTHSGLSSGSLPAEVQQWEVQWEDLQVERAIGRGSYGRVRSGIGGG